MRKWFIEKLKNNKGHATITFICCCIFLYAIFYVIMMAFTPMIVKANVITYTASLVREIEKHGAIDNETIQYAQELATLYNLKPQITYEADYISGTNRINIRHKFKVSVKTEVEIVLLDSNFFGTTTKKIEVGSRKEGMSEVLWK